MSRPVVTDEMVERGASALALHEDYDPNAVPSQLWPAITRKYQDRARVVLTAALAEGREHSPAAPASCCDGSGQVHHGEGPLRYVTLCRDADCVARREAAWAAECGEASASGEEQ
jgi:hypothetical protein